jgi:hypothetical protein
VDIDNTPQLVMMAQHDPVPGSKGRTCSLPAALSSTTSMRRLPRQLRKRAALACAGISVIPSNTTGSVWCEWIREAIAPVARRVGLLAPRSTFNLLEQVGEGPLLSAALGHTLSVHTRRCGVEQKVQAVRGVVFWPFCAGRGRH